MASTDFEVEKTAFREHYDSHRMLLEEAKDAFVALIRSLLLDAGTVEISKIEGRVKNREECIQKFNRKYRPALEASETPYAIRDHISDLIGIRVVCLYEDQIRTLHETLGDDPFEVLATTDKIANIENTEASFGYKGLHLDLRLSPTRSSLPEYRRYAQIPFELQLRTIVQDSWSVLDHKIKYKKSIPNSLKRRINTLAALFELADREFRTIREATDEEIRLARQEGPSLDYVDGGDCAEPINVTGAVVPSEGAIEGATVLPIEARSAPLDAFGLLRIASHFYRDFDFEPRKVDGFAQEIVSADPNIRRSDLNRFLRTTISHVKKYQADFEIDTTNGSTMNPYTVIRHCLWLAEPTKFSSMLTTVARERFEAWLHSHPRPGIV